MEYKEKLNRAIANLYAVFAKYPLKFKIEGCPCCISDAEELKLHSTDLEKLSYSDLGSFPYNAITTVGDIDDFKHFLPRILELIIGEERGIQKEIIFSKLTWGKYTSWPQEEYIAIDDFLMSWWNFILTIDIFEYLPPSKIEESILSISFAVTNIIPYLDTALLNKSPNAIPNLIEFFSWNEYLSNPTKEKSGVWQEDKLSQIRIWLENKGNIDALKRNSYFEHWKMAK